MSQLALHRLESVVDYLRERLVRSVVLLRLLCHKLMASRDRHVDSDAERIPLLVGVVRLFDRDVTPVDVVAKFFEAR